MTGSTPDDDWREDCAPRRTLDLFATKWTSMVLHTLEARHGGRARTGVLQRSLPGISKKMLTQTLREMEATGLLTRHVSGTVPPAVAYDLTPLGRRFVEAVELLYDWGRRNADALDQLGRRRTGRRDRPDAAGDGVDAGARALDPAGETVPAGE
ncbi:winged helix-turn-helix transcriptional regulator [Lichenibacterium ramalinae]|uniref:Transcriptional regulator n=1 Tax=Lichenibacterium ramalinae TaxID=2316527 RepID=A0A4Q2R8G0_9HYPH|nr:helix-turn-helix domain-containing protein [Lichenibacterium ramalinae]RYB03110.1 transcriptional regulator [Lichenibacterium ramalinae]